MSLVDLRDVSKRYRRVEALAGLTLRIEEGEVLGLLGHNGAGKTTTMKLILGLIRPTGGELRVFGTDPHGSALRELHRQCGFLPESVSFYEQLTGREVLRFYAKLKGVGVAECERLLERVGLAGAAGRRVRTYSKGMRQRLGLAQALAGEPRLLLLDEPTVGLDPVATREFFETVDELRSRGVTIVLCTHALPGIERHIDRAAILANGRLLALGSLEQLRERAGLPLTIRVRGTWQSGRWDGRLRGEGVSVTRVNGTCLELTGPLACKMDLVRELLAEPGVEDIEMRPPTLEDLYVHLGEEAPR